MDWAVIRLKVTDIAKKYKYVLAVLLLGMVLMALPDGDQQVQEAQIPEQEQVQPGTAEALEAILSQIEGVGDAEVLLTEAAGSTTIYQTDEDSTISSDSQSLRVETVIVSDSQRGEQGLVERVDPPTYLGAIVVCEGADRPTVRLAVVEAVSNATGISTDRVTVLKMK